MSDYAEIRAALDAGPTPGPWESGQFSGKEKYAIGPDINHRAADAYGSANARYISAANPEAIRALLAERDAMKAALEEALIWHESQDKAISKQPNANTGHNGWMRAQHQEQAALIRAALAQGEV